MRHLLVALLLIATGALLLLPSDNCVDFYLLGYSGKGVLIPAKLCSIPYPGAYTEAGVTGSRLSESLLVAYKAFSHRHGPLPWGVILSIEGPTSSVDGRSADIALYSALYALTAGKKPPLATGKIGDDLYSVEGVAYVREKLQATTDLVVIPFANRRSIPPGSQTVTVKNLDGLDGVLASLPS